jgi:hypothetical protein
MTNVPSPLPSAAPPGSLRTLVGVPVFGVSGTDYCYEDVILAAQAWGLWPALEEEVRQGVACLKRVQATGESLAAEAEAAANEFRVEHNLFSVEDMTAWLAERGLSATLWLTYVWQLFLRKRWADQLDDLVTRHPVSEDEVGRYLKVVGLCSGHLSRYAGKLAGRAAVHDRMRGETPPAGSGRAGAFPLRRTPAPDSRLCLLLGLSLERGREKLEALGHLEESMGLLYQQVVTPAALQHQVALRYLDWVWLDCLSVSFPSMPMAREAALCVRHDQESLADVATRARRPLQQEQVYVEQAGPELRDPLLSARPGELLGPLACDGEFRLLLVRAKVMPSAEDPDVRLLAEDLLLQGIIEREVSQRVHWYRP